MSGAGTVKKVTSVDEFNKELEAAGDKLVVVDFFAEWCGPCKMIAPKLVELAGKLSDVLFLKVDVDELEDLAQTYDIKAMPTFLFFKNKEKKDLFTGANATKLVEMIENKRK